MKIVKLTWNDAYSHDCWQNIPDATDSTRTKMICHTIGFLIDKDKDHITIAHTVNDADQTTGVMHIPKGCIEKIEYL